MLLSVKLSSMYVISRAPDGAATWIMSSQLAHLLLQQQGCSSLALQCKQNVIDGFSTLECYLDFAQRMHMYLLAILPT